MRLGLLVAVMLLESVVYINCFKINPSDLYGDSLFVENSNKLPSPILYPANRQGSLYDEDSLIYKNTLNALLKAAEEEEESAAANQNDDYSQEYYSSALGSLESSDEIKTDQRDMETQSHSSLGEGHQYVQGGAGEGFQHLHPDGSVLNNQEIKSDEDLPAYCNPPNPCPIGYSGEECDPRPFEEFTAEYSKTYQENQDCVCDYDHNECKNANRSNDKYTYLISNLQLKKSDERFSAVVAKKSPRAKRSVGENANKLKKNPYMRGRPIRLHVAKKSQPV